MEYSGLLADEANAPASSVFPPARSPEPKAWEQYTLERIATGPAFRTQHLLVVKDGRVRGKASQVILATSDMDRALRVEQRIRRALISLTVSEFESLIGIPGAVRTAADVVALPV